MTCACDAVIHDLSSNVRVAISNLIGEVASDDAPMWRTTSATYTAKQLRHEVASGTDLGRQYVSDLLRVARDMLARQARISPSVSADVAILDALRERGPMRNRELLEAADSRMHVVEPAAHNTVSKVTE